jgi:hypothetical protein
MEPPGRVSVYRKAAESAIGTFVILFGANTIGDYMQIKDQYPTAWSITNMLVLFIFSLSHNFYRNPPWPRQASNGKVETAENGKSSSVLKFIENYFVFTAAQCLISLGLAVLLGSGSRTLNSSSMAFHLQ